MSLKKNGNLLSIGNTTFKLLGKLGEGTYGSVYKVDYEGNQYALKYIQNSDNGGKKEGIKSLRELDIMSRLRHPHLMHAEKIFASYSVSSHVSEEHVKNKEEKGSTLGILMPLAPGGDLLKKNFDKKFTLEERFTLLYQVCSAVNFMHQAGYLHLDIKPMNILLFNNKYAKLTDFGLSLILEKKKDRRFKYFPIQLVTVDHRAPEIMEGDYYYTTASDVWSLGITFIETLSFGNSIYRKPDGEYFSDDDYTDEKVFNIYKTKLTPQHIRQTLQQHLVLKNVNANVKNMIYEIIEKMLDFNPEKRATMNDIMEFFNYLFALNDPSILDEKDRYIPEGIYMNPKPYVDNKIDSELVKIGFNKMNEVASRIALSTETLFLAADIYQRTLKYSHTSTSFKKEEKGEEKEKNIKNITFSAILSLYLAIKMIESFFDDPQTLTELSGNIFPSDYLMLGESIVVPALEGIMYPDNLFIASITFNRLLKGYTILPDNKVYPTIDLDQWYQMSLQESKTQGVFSKYIPYRDFLSLF